MPVWIGDERRDGDELVSTDPAARPRRRGRRRRRRTRPRRRRAAAERGVAAWGADAAPARAPRCSSAAAALLRERRPSSPRSRCASAAKPWAEADADVCEAIDFLEYYARGALELDQGAPLIQVPGERNELRYAPRGVVAVIAPWNFPLAIPLGMMAAGAGDRQRRRAQARRAVAGLRGRCSSRRCARRACRPRARAAARRGRRRRRARRGPARHTIAFTGSGAVGLEIIRAAAEPPEASASSSASSPRWAARTA